ncbi:MAG: peptide/nickel transport system ATP-binding protein [Solirubrobacteraceae bacterium]
MSTPALSVPTVAPDMTASESQTRVGAAIRWAASNAALVLLGLIAALAIGWPLVAPFNPLDVHAGTPLQPPSGAHLLGTDDAGRDVLSRVLAGTRISFTVGIASATLAVVIGGLLGVTSAMAPRWVGEVIMRVLDLMLAFPAILLAVVLATAVGTGMLTTIIVIGVVYTPVMARFVRGLTLTELAEDYILAARVLGTSRRRLVGYHLGVNLAVPVLVFATLLAGSAVMVEAALSFIGIGITPPTPSWGNIINDGKAFLLSGQWWMSTAGGLAIFVTVLTLNGAAHTLDRRLEAEVRED